MFTKSRFLRVERAKICGLSQRLSLCSLLIEEGVGGMVSFHFPAHSRELLHFAKVCNWICDGLRVKARDQGCFGALPPLFNCSPIHIQISKSLVLWILPPQ